MPTECTWPLETVELERNNKVRLFINGHRGLRAKFFLRLCSFYVAVNGNRREQYLVFTNTNLFFIELNDKTLLVLSKIYKCVRFFRFLVTTGKEADTLTS